MVDPIHVLRQMPDLAQPAHQKARIMRRAMDTGRNLAVQDRFDGQ